MFVGLQQSHSTTESAITVLQLIPNLGNHDCVTKRFACLHETSVISCSCNEGMGRMQLCKAGGAYFRSQEPASGREWMIEIPKRNGGNGFLKTNMSHKSPLAVSHILNTWAAEPHLEHDWEHNHCIVTNLGENNSVTKRFACLHETSVSFCHCNKGMGMMQLFLDSTLLLVYSAMSLLYRKLINLNLLRSYVTDKSLKQSEWMKGSMYP